LAPFVDVSRQAIMRDLKAECEVAGVEMSDDAFSRIVEARVRKEIKKGVQTIQYQVVTLMTTNGQAPFVTVYMYLGEAKNEVLRNDLALVIEEVLKERIVGVKNERGVYVTPAFPKLIYVLEEQNIREGTPFWYLTELAAKCTAK
jgi:ribonucleoside-triphosphate reductase